MVRLSTRDDFDLRYEYNRATRRAAASGRCNGESVAMQQAGALTYLHRDHLGSLVSATNPAGTEVASLRHWPFGDVRLLGGTLPTDRLFTGQTRDLGDDRFYFFKARYYDATIGKFPTPDTVVPDPTNPQALNRYAYALNNPLRLVDPSGHFTEDQLKKWGYTPAQITAWQKGDPEWYDLLAAAQLGDRVTGLWPYTSGSPVVVGGTFAIEPVTGSASGRLIVQGPTRFADLADFGKNVTTDRALWRYSGADDRYNLVQTPHVFLTAGPPRTPVLRPPEPGDTRFPGLLNPLYSVAKPLEGVAGLIEPTSFGPLTPIGPGVDIAAESAIDTAVQPLAPQMVGQAGVVWLVLQLLAAEYKGAFESLYGRYGG
jgi:RHS repeat-associated protein